MTRPLVFFCFSLSGLVLVVVVVVEVVVVVAVVVVIVVVCIVLVVVVGLIFLKNDTLIKDNEKIFNFHKNL